MSLLIAEHSQSYIYDNKHVITSHIHLFTLFIYLYYDLVYIKMRQLSIRDQQTKTGLNCFEQDRIY